MATIDSAAPWSDGGGCRNQRAPRIGDIQRHKALEMDRTVTTPTSPTTSSTNNNNNNGTSVSANNLLTNHYRLLEKDRPLSTSHPPCPPTSAIPETIKLSDSSRDATTGDKDDCGGGTTDDTNIESLASDIGKVRLVEKNDRINMKNEESSAELTLSTSSSSSTSSTSFCKNCCCNNSTDGDGSKMKSHTSGIRDNPKSFISFSTITIPLTTTTTTLTTITTSKPSSAKCYSTIALTLPPHIRILPKTQSLDLVDDNSESDGAYLSTSKSSEIPTIKGMISKIQSLDQTRPIYPNVPYSPYGSPYGSPRAGRRRPPLRESRRISIEQSGSFLQLNQYKLLDQIGQGSYGLVKLAYSEEDSTHYAMKILSKRKLLRKAGLLGRGPKRATSPLDRVYREIAVLKKLDHPNVVKLIEVLDDPLEDSLYLVFELVQQGEVLSIPTEQPLGEERAWCVFRDALLGLEYLHYQRIIHGDIKPGNLLLGECGRVKMADLGVCNEFFGEDAAMNNGSTAGTPAFRAPETLLLGQHSYSGKAADIWALGATLYALVYGNVPFVATSVPAVYEKIKHEELKFPEQPAINPELRDLIEKMLDKDPGRRITLPLIKFHNWVTANGTYSLPSEEENCRLVQISEEDINSVVKSIPKLDTLILIKTMLKKHSFLNPFSKGVISGRAPQRGGSRLERFSRSGRSNSAPGAYHTSESFRQLSNENLLPSVTEGVPSTNESLESPNEDVYKF